MQNISISDVELLKFAIENGILDTALVQQRIEMQKRKELLDKHPYKIYQGKDGNWYTYLPDGAKGRLKVKRNTRQQIEERVIEYWKMQEEIITVESVFKEWATDKLEREEISKSTYDRYFQDFDKYFVSIKALEIRKIDADLLENFAKNIIHEFKMSSKCYSNCRTIIYGIFKRAKKKKLISFSVTEAVNDMEISKKSFKKVIKNASDQVYLPQEKRNMEKYLRENLDIVNLGLLFMFKTGVRIGELATLERTKVENYTVQITATETRYKDENGKVHYEVKEFPKSEAGLRYAILPEKYEWILDEIMKLNPDGKYLFEKGGKRLKTYSFRRRLEYICSNKLNMKPKSPHKVRKTYGTILLDGNIKESTILNTMGHTDIECTKGHYYFDRSGIEDKRKELSALVEL